MFKEIHALRLENLSEVLISYKSALPSYNTRELSITRGAADRNLSKNCFTHTRYIHSSACSSL